MKNKKFILFRPSECESMNAFIIDGLVELEKWRKDGSIEDGDEIYEVQLFNKAKRKTEIIFEE